MLFALVVGGWWLLKSPSPGRADTPQSALPNQPLSSPDSQSLMTCPLQPAVAAAGGKDGQFPLQPDLKGLSVNEIASFMVIGKEAASAGRPRDAEIAFMMSCRVASQLRSPASVEAADAKYQLGSHYAMLAQEGQARPADGVRTELLWRSQLLYSDSLNTYHAKLGDAHEKSRFAAEGLAAVRQILAQAQTPAPVPQQPPPAPASSQAPAPREVEVATSIPPMPAVRPKPATASNRPVFRTAPSFDCGKARSVPEKLICSDAELAQLDRELGRVYARARQAAPDRAAFRRQQNQEWAWRESNCRDRDCLLRWYAQRRDQLMNDIEGRRQSPAKG